MIDLSNFFNIYRTHPDEEPVHRSLVGRIMLTDNSFHVLEDHSPGRWLTALEKLPPADVAQRIHALARNSMYYTVIPLSEIHEGHHEDLIPSVQGEKEMPEARFSYHRTGMSDPQILEFHEGKAFLDGHPLDEQDLELMLQNVAADNATLDYADVKKSEDLIKIEPELEQALAGLREAVKGGHIDQSVLKTLSRQIFADSMVPTVGNKKAYEDFLSRPRAGVHGVLDGNSFGAINKVFGQSTGDEAIKAYGNAIRDAMDEAVGRGNGKVHRIGGDEFHFHVPSHEHAALFARTLRNHLEAIPPIGGSHQLSVSMGFGPTPHHAEQALLSAKAAKKASGAAPGQEKSFVHSGMPGAEGPIPLDAEKLKLQAPPAPTAASPAAPAPTAQPEPAKQPLD